MGTDFSPSSWKTAWARARSSALAEIYWGELNPFLHAHPRPLSPRILPEYGTSTELPSYYRKGRGQEIDQHDSVIRFLDAPVLGCEPVPRHMLVAPLHAEPSPIAQLIGHCAPYSYEADVGNRTTLSVIKAGVSTRPGVLKALEALNDVEYFGFERLR